MDEIIFFGRSNHRLNKVVQNANHVDRTFELVQMSLLAVVSGSIYSKRLSP